MHRVAIALTTIIIHYTTFTKWLIEYCIAIGLHVNYWFA